MQSIPALFQNVLSNNNNPAMDPHHRTFAGSRQNTRTCSLCLHRLEKCGKFDQTEQPSTVCVCECVCVCVHVLFGVCVCEGERMSRSREKDKKTGDLFSPAGSPSIPLIERSELNLSQALSCDTLR